MAGPQRVLSPLTVPRNSSRPNTPSPLSNSVSSSPIDSSPTLLASSTLSAASDEPKEVIEPASIALGRLEDVAYAKLLPAWRDNLRKRLVASLHREMFILEAIQKYCRTPWLDEYFVKTSLLGTHSFFMICVPMPFWFGRADIGRGLLYVLAGGGYLTSVLKDLLCVPRPFSPPLVRLSVGNHALEYGFPSTHSSTTVSMALYFSELLHRSSAEHTQLNTIVYTILGIVAVSVVFGRLYTGMHSITDVTIGSLVGFLVWFLHWISEDLIMAYTQTSRWLVTSTMIPLTLFLVFVHPAPAEDCPCFEDAVAFLSVVCGLLVSRNWIDSDYLHTTAGSNWQGSLQSLVLACAVLAKLVLGVVGVLSWRLIAKEVCHRILPPIFRFFSNFLLTRRHYLAATKCEPAVLVAAIDDFQAKIFSQPYRLDDKYENSELHAIPSILDLPSLSELEAEQDSAETSAFTESTTSKLSPALRNRTNNSVNEDPLERLKQRQQTNSNLESSGKLHSAAKIGRARSNSRTSSGGDGIRRDADVLTKVIVYAGIGFVAEVGMPKIFWRIGLSV